jgi:hypothetical protein
MKRPLLLLGLALAPRATRAQAVELDHVWVVVAGGAPERRALEAAGLRVWPTVQRHEGQGTAAVMVELDGTFLELLWPDSTVAVAPGREVAAAKFRARQRWRTSGWSPFGIGLRTRAGAPDSLPFTTWPLRLAWMAPGEALRMLTARADTTSPSVWVVPRSSALEDATIPAAARRHPNGARTITALRLTMPRAAPETEAVRALVEQRVVTLARGEAWLLEVTMDGGVRGRERDLRPALPLVVRW